MNRVFVFSAFFLLFPIACLSACPFKHNGGPCPHDEHEVKAPPAMQGTPTTVSGCACDSECGATLDFGQATCDWCYTKDKCGHYSYTRGKYYDYCVYPNNDNYEAQTWNQKLDQIWAQIVGNPGSGVYPNQLGLLSESIQTSFDDMWDVMPAGRKKYIHSIGAVCKVKWDIPSTSNYTGIFAPGSWEGVIRLGSAKAIDESSGVTPGIGIKFTRTNYTSTNWVALYTLEGQDSYNFFKNTLSNHIPPPTTTILKTLAKKFEQASNCPTQVGLSDGAKVDQNGNKAIPFNFPFQLFHVPNGDLNFPDTYISQADMLQKFSEVKVGTTLYKMQAKASPGSPVEDLGSLVTTSQCVASKWGDEHLYFRHQRIEEDWEIRPNWLKSIDTPKLCGQTASSVPPKRCANYEDKIEYINAILSQNLTLQ